MSAPCNT